MNFFTANECSIRSVVICVKNVAFGLPGNFVRSFGSLAVYNLYSKFAIFCKIVQLNYLPDKDIFHDLQNCNF